MGTLGSVDPSLGGQYLLAPYAAAFLGAAAIQVGRFNVVGTLLALYLIVVGTTGSGGSTQRIDEHTGARVNSCRVVCGKSGGRG